VVAADILFRTSTIVHAFHDGVQSIWSAADGEEANLLAFRIRRSVRVGSTSQTLLRLRGGRAAPARPGVPAWQQLVYCTTNGTVALRRAASGAFVYAGSLLNGAWEEPVAATFTESSTVVTGVRNADAHKKLES
jgi:phosphosulfolactate phosphohydrolase-like enzyme